MFSTILRRIPHLFVFAALSVFLAPPQAHAVYWTVEGPGETDLIVTGNKAIFSYNLDVSRSYGVFEWSLIGHRFRPGTHVFKWDYDGSHDRNNLSTILRAPDHELVSPGTGKGSHEGGFLFEGRGLTIENTQWDDFHFRMIGESDDLSKALRGTLEITMVPVPAPFLLLTVAIGGLSLVARRSTSSRGLKVEI